MMSIISRFVSYLILCSLLAFQPAHAQAILRDAESEAVLQEIARPIVLAARLDPDNVKIVLVDNREINAFVAAGQTVYIHSGLILAADNAAQVQGVIAHEIGHIEGGHVVTFGQVIKEATGTSVISLLLGAVTMVAGGGEAAMGIISAGQKAAEGKFLAFSRVQESSADAAAARYLNKAGLSGKGMLDFFGKLRHEEYRLSSSYDATDPFARTHPMSADRQSALEQTLKSAPSFETKTNPDLEIRFQRVKAKLAGFAQEPVQTLRQYPERDQSVVAHYARAWALHRSAYPDKALYEIDALLAIAPRDPYYLELKGQILLESGNAKAALPLLRDAVELSGAQPLIATQFGHALIATEDTANYEEARKVLRVAVERDRDNPSAWYQLGIIYESAGDHARSSLATAERQMLLGAPGQALASAWFAAEGLQPGSSDWMRAQDILSTAREALGSSSL